MGTEVSTTAGHVLGLGIPDPVFRFSGDAQDALLDIRDLGGAAFAAHPLSQRPDFRWSGWTLPGPWGLELLNGDSQWREAGWGRLLLTASLYGPNSRYALLRSLSPPASTLQQWDRLLASRDVAGIAGADAHSRVPISRRMAPRFPSYESLFRLAQNHVLLDRPLSKDAASDARTIAEALARGRSYVGLDALASAAGFSFTAASEGRRSTMGETVLGAGSLRLRAGGRMPPGTRIRLLKDGQLHSEAAGALDVPASGPGVYRVEAYVPGSALPWILTNPIYVFDAEAAQARAARAAWPPVPDPPEAVLSINDFEPGHDPSSKLAKDILDPDGAARLAFELGVPSETHKSPFVAIVSWAKRDLTGRRGLVFSLKSDGVYRVWVQVRDENKASADEGTEWWFASVKSTPEWRRIALPFERLRSINPRTDGRLDLDKVRAIVFVIDRGSLKGGTRGTLLVDDVGVY